jgi:crossover junction endodeoxyribonuclease RuvC
MAAMLKTLLNIKEAPKMLDATDALAVAVCHHFQNGSLQSRAKSWKNFVADNPSRVK